MATQVEAAGDDVAITRFDVPTKGPTLSTLEGTLMEEDDDEADEPDLLNGQVIQMLDTQVPTQLVPQELLMTQVDSQAEWPVAGTQVPGDSQSVEGESPDDGLSFPLAQSPLFVLPDRTQGSMATLVASPAATRGRSSGTQATPAPASSYQEVASQLEQDLATSSLRLEERLRVFSPATQVPVPLSQEDGAAKEAPIKSASPAKTLDTKTTPAVTARARAPMDPTTIKPTAAERDYVGQKIAKYVEGLEFREVRGIVRVHDPT